MPQMAPYNWFMLNIMFTMIFLMYIILLNYIYLTKKIQKKKKIFLNFNIKW